MPACAGMTIVFVGRFFLPFHTVTPAKAGVPFGFLSFNAVFLQNS